MKGLCAVTGEDEDDAADGNRLTAWRRVASLPIDRDRYPFLFYGEGFLAAISHHRPSCSGQQMMRSLTNRR